MKPNKHDLDINSDICEAITLDLRACPLSRVQVAGMMAEITGKKVTEYMLYNWSAESKKRWCMPLHFLPAFIIATKGEKRTLDVLIRGSGLAAFLAEIIRPEFKHLDNYIKTLQKERRKAKAFLKKIDRGWV
jgi:hypothetical protein